MVKVAEAGQGGPAPVPKNLKLYNTQLPKRGGTTGVAPAAAAAAAAISKPGYYYDTIIRYYYKCHKGK